MSKLKDQHIHIKTSINKAIQARFHSSAFMNQSSSIQQLLDSSRLSEESETVIQIPHGFIGDIAKPMDNPMNLDYKSLKGYETSKDYSPEQSIIQEQSSNNIVKVPFERAYAKSTSRPSTKATLASVFNTTNATVAPSFSFLSTTRKSKGRIEFGNIEIRTRAFDNNLQTPIRLTRCTPIGQKSTKSNNNSDDKRKFPNKNKLSLPANILENSWINDAESTKSIALANTIRNMANLSKNRSLSDSQSLLHNEMELKKIKLLEFLKPSRARFTKLLRTGDHSGCAKEIIDTMQIAVDEDLLEILIQALKMLGNLFFGFKKWYEAIFYFNQLRILCELTNSPSKKLYGFIKLSECAKSLGKFQEAIHILRTGLQYAWTKKIKASELKIYDHMGMIYFHLGELQKARYYHTRALENIYELEGTIAFEKYQFEYNQLKKQNIKFKNISLQLLSKLKLPVTLTNPRELKISGSTISDSFKKPNFTTNQFLEEENQMKSGLKKHPDILLDIILKDQEFECNLPSPRCIVIRKDTIKT